MKSSTGFAAAQLAAKTAEVCGKWRCSVLPSRSHRERASARWARPVRCDLRRLSGRPHGPCSALRWVCRGEMVYAGASAAGACGLLCHPSWPDGGRAFGTAWKDFESGVSSSVLPPAARRCGVAAIAAPWKNFESAGSFLAFRLLLFACCAAVRRRFARRGQTAVCGKSRCSKSSFPL